MIPLIAVMDWLVWALWYRQLPYQGPQASARDVYRQAGALDSIQQVARFQRRYAVGRRRLNAETIGP